MGSEHSTSQVTGSSFLPSKGFRIVDLHASSDGSIWFSSNLKWLSLDRKYFCDTGSGFLRPRYIDSDDAECDGVFCFDFVSITFVTERGTAAPTFRPTLLFGTIAHLSNCWALIMAALCNRADHYIFALWFLLSIFYLLFFPRLISAVADWMSTILLHMVWP